MKRSLSKAGWLIVFCCIVLIGGVAYAQQFKPGSEPDGFRGIKWGQDISTVDGLVYVFTAPSYGGIDFYTREKDELRIGPVVLKGIAYSFWQDKFCDVIISCTEEFTNWIKLKTVIFEKFGEGVAVLPPSKEIGEVYIWFGDKTLMMLGYDVEGGGIFFISSLEMRKQQREWEKQQIKEGVEEGW